MLPIDEAVIREVAGRVGNPPRRFGMFRWRHGRSQPPEWLKAGDLIGRIYEHQDRILRDGPVRWAAVVHANYTLFQPGPTESGAQVVYAPVGDVPLEVLGEIARRTFALKNTRPADPAERRVADMLTDERERALDWPVPRSVSGGADIVTTVVMLPRHHLPGGFLGNTHFPIVADPATRLALLVPCQYWPAAFYDAWKANTDAMAARLEAAPVVTLTAEAAEQVRATAAASGYARYWLRAGVRSTPEHTFSYVLDIVEAEPDPRLDVVSESQSVPVVVDRASRVYIEGTVIDFSDGPSGRGFVFQNPNAER